jgi:hypothetical protein
MSRPKTPYLRSLKMHGRSDVAEGGLCHAVGVSEGCVVPRKKPQLGVATARNVRRCNWVKAILAVEELRCERRREGE